MENINLQKKVKLYAQIGTLDQNGFLRIKVFINRIGVIDYALNEIDENYREMKPIKDRGYALGFVSPEALFDQQAMKDIAGKPVEAYEHEWLIPDGAVKSQYENYNNIVPISNPKKVQIGNVAGEARANGKFLEADALITNAEIIDKIRNQELIEISPGYTSFDLYKPGFYKDKEYDFYQTPPCSYNHILLLPKYQGRAGREVRIIASKPKTIKEGSKKKMADEPITLNTTEGLVKVFSNTDSEKVVKILSSVEKLQAENSELQGKITALSAIKKDSAEKDKNIKTLEKINSELEGKITAFEAKIKDFSSPEYISKTIKEQEEVTAVANSLGITDDTGWLTLGTKHNITCASPADKKEVLVKEYLSQKQLSIPNSQINENGRVKEGYITGVWQMVTTNKSTFEPQPTIPVAKIFNAQPQNSHANKSVAERMGYKKEDK